jgi:hypothetical protein
MTTGYYSHNRIGEPHRTTLERRCCSEINPPTQRPEKIATNVAEEEKRKTD